MSIAISTTGLHQQTLVSRSSLRLSRLERAALCVGLVEIPLQIDKYFLFHERDADLGAVGGINVSITTCCLVVLYWLWFAGAAIRRQPCSRSTVFGVPMLAYLVSVAVSIVAAPLPLLSVFDLVLLLQAYALFFYMANRIQTREDLIFSLLVFAGSLLIQSFLIFGLVLTGTPGEETQVGPILLSVWEDGRPAGSMQSPVLAGSVLAITVLPVATLTMLTVSRRTRQLAALATGCGLFAILLTQTRGAILTTVLGGTLIGGALLMRGWLPKWTLFVAVLLAGICAYPLMRVIEKRVRGDDGGSAIARKHHAAIALEMINDQPLFGYGAGNCHLAGQKYADQGAYRSEWYYTIHCKYLLVWIETGIAGLATFLLVLFNGIRQGVLTWLRHDRLLAPIGLALAAAVVGHMLHMFVDVFNSRTQVQTLWAVLGMVAAVYELGRQETLGASPAPSFRQMTSQGGAV